MRAKKPVTRVKRICFGEARSIETDITWFDIASVVAGDFNKDGRQDLVVAAWKQNRVVFLENTGIEAAQYFDDSVILSPTWDPKEEFDTPVCGKQVVTRADRQPDGLVAADLNRDGLLDVAVANFQTNDVAWYRNATTVANGSTSVEFSDKQTIYNRWLDDYYKEKSYTSLAVADLDGDGWKDLIVGASRENPDQTGRIGWLKNQGATFVNGEAQGDFCESDLSVINFGATGKPSGGQKGISEVITADLDQDGVEDVLYAAISAQGQDTFLQVQATVGWYKGGAEGVFVGPVTNTNTVGRDGVVNTIYSTGDGNENAAAVATSDIDRDGKLDVVSAGEVQGQLTWYRNIASKKTVDIQVVYAPMITFLKEASSVDESSGAKTKVVVRLSASSDLKITVGYAVTGSAEAGKDYTSASNTLKFEVGQIEKTLFATVINGTLKEGDEDIVLRLTDPENAVLGSDFVHTLTIEDDDDALDVPVLSIDNGMATEGSVAIFRVTLSAFSEQDVSVVVNSQKGTATPDSDYTKVSRTLTIPAGDISGTIEVEVLCDLASPEDPETATVTLSKSVGAVIDASASVGTLTILEGSALPSLSIQDVKFLETDEDVDVEITVSLSTAEPINEVTVEYATFDGDRDVTGQATAGSDYLSTSGTCTFEAGDTTKTFFVKVRPDTLEEGDETVLLILRNAINASIGSEQGSAILTITDLTIVIPNPTGDDDNDGITNIQEVSDGSDPLNPDDPVEGGGNDDDGDELTNGVEANLPSNPDDPNDPVLNGDGDDDGDGLKNGWEKIYDTGPNNANRPVINGGPNALGIIAPAAIEMVATGVGSGVLLGEVKVTGGQYPISLTLAGADGVILTEYVVIDDSGRTVTPDAIAFLSGVKTLTWRALESQSRDVSRTQTLSITPLVNLGAGIMVSESSDDSDGTRVSIAVQLTGKAVNYPVTIPYTLGGSALEGTDYSVTPDVFVIAQNETHGSISFSITEDAEVENDETIEIALGTPLNALVGALPTQRLTLVESNIAPQLSSTVVQPNDFTTVIASYSGVVKVTPLTTDPHADDSLSFVWDEAAASLGNVTDTVDGARNVLTSRQALFT